MLTLCGSLHQAGIQHGSSRGVRRAPEAAAREMMNPAADPFAVCPKKIAPGGRWGSILGTLPSKSTPGVFFNCGCYLEKVTFEVKTRAQKQHDV